ncbi:MFS transporter [Pseudonocardia kunmingensis]|uniref:EmrB/QacA subfamily drug resistance transporter n=1 Tax=Pseudonocardia kunmingensis TaxID=630975 RepID=A0A543DAY8_9PSEU|nr:MFS transporter [Pseudonocardia kunmingensis]TQM06448.1 EmrB/QacA subfamily drug resistance transporter [Pseudonocardia kunmingensis]
MTTETSEPGRAPTTTGQVRRAPRRLVLALTCAATTMAGLDTAVVNVALASIQHDLGAGHGTLQWVVVAYGLLLGGFLLLGGRLADHMGRRRVFLAGLTVFTAASLLAGAAQDAVQLIAARGVQGFGAALIIPAALSLLAVTFAEGPERDRAFGLLGAVGGVTASGGVVLGGLLASGPGWRWSFLVNVPIGVVLIAVVLLFLAPDRCGDRTGRLDVAGATTVTGGLLLAVYAAHHAVEHGWSSVSTLALAGAAVVLLALFVRIEARSDGPLVPAALLRNRSLVAANVTAFLGFCALLSFIFVGSLLMQQVLGYSPWQAGMAWVATTGTIVVAAVAGARLVGRVGVRSLLLVGLGLVAVGALWLARIPADAGFVSDLLPAFLLAGVGFGFCEPAVQLGALSRVAPSDTGLASGLVQTTTEIGGAVGVAAVSTVLVAGVGLDGFHAAFAFVTVLALLGVVTAAVGFARRGPTAPVR